MFKRRLSVCSQYYYKFDNSTYKTITSTATLNVTVLSATNSVVNKTAAGLTNATKFNEAPSEENSKKKLPSPTLAPNKKPRLFPLERSCSLPTISKPVAAKKADVDNESLLKVSHFLVPCVHLEKMDTNQHGAVKLCSDALLKKEKSTSSVAAQPPNSISVSAVTSWTSKNVTHSNGVRPRCEMNRGHGDDQVQPDHRNQDGGGTACQSAETLQDKVVPANQPTGLSVEVLAEALRHLKNAMNLFKQYDPDRKRSSTVNTNICNNIECYFEMFENRRKPNQVSFAVPKTSGDDETGLGLKKANEKQHGGYTFKTLPCATLDNLAASQVQFQEHKSDELLLASPVEVTDVSPDDNIFEAALGTTPANLVGALPSSVDLHAGSAVPRSKSTAGLSGNCSKVAVKAALPEPAAPSQGNIKASKKHQAKAGDSFDAEEITAQDPIIVYFDLETTGLAYSHEIVQVSCVCSCLEGERNSANFNMYALPDGDFDPRASYVTKLTKHHDNLYLNGEKVGSVSLAECLRQLVSWLQQLPRPALLLGHNSRTFDAPRLLLALWNCNLLHAFQLAVWGFADSLPWAKATNPRLRSYRLQELSARYCRADLTAHNALNDCLILEKVVLALARIVPRDRAQHHAGKLPSTSEVSRQTPVGRTNFEVSGQTPVGRTNSEVSRKREAETRSSEVSRQTSIGRTQPNPGASGQSNGSSGSASNINGAQRDNACVPPNGTCDAQGTSRGFASSRPCAEKVCLLETLKPFVFSTGSVMVGIRRSQAARACLSNAGS